MISNALALGDTYLSFVYLLPRVLTRRLGEPTIKSNKTIPYPLYNGSIVLDYFLLGKKKFTELNKSYFLIKSYYEIFLVVGYLLLFLPIFVIYFFTLRTILYIYMELILYRQ